MKTISIFSTILLLSCSLNAQKQFTNSGNFKVFPGTSITFFGDLVNNGTFSDSGLVITLQGSTSQSIGGSSTTTFNNLTINNNSVTSPQIILNANTIVKQTVNMTRGNVNLNSKTFTIGTSGTSPGLLDYTAGSMYGGELKRWFSASTLSIGDESRGLFPMGSSTGDFRPAWIGWSSTLTSEGTISVVHHPVYPLEMSPTIYTDASWGGGTPVLATYTSDWTVSSGNSFALSGSTGKIRFGGEGFGTFNLTDINASLLDTTTGTFAAATNSVTALEVNRTGLSTANLSNTWFVGSQVSNMLNLPYSLLTFTVFCENNEKHLEWSTATETNNDFFTIERCTDGMTWQNFAIVPGASESTATQYYSLFDPEILPGITEYRIAEKDIHNAVIGYTTIRSEDCKGSSDFTTYPNPSTGVINIQVAGDEQILSTDIINTSSILVYSSNNFNPEIDL